MLPGPGVASCPLGSAGLVNPIQAVRFAHRRLGLHETMDGADTLKWGEIWASETQNGRPDGVNRGADPKGRQSHPIYAPLPSNQLTIYACLPSNPTLIDRIVRDIYTA